MTKLPRTKKLLADENPRDFARKEANDRMTREDWNGKCDSFEQPFALIIDKATDDVAAIVSAGDKYLIDIRTAVWMCLAVLCVIAWRVW